MKNVEWFQWGIQAGARDTHPLLVQILTFSCSFLLCGCCTPFWGILDPPLHLVKSIELDEGKVKMKNVKWFSHFRTKPAPDYHAPRCSPLYTEVIFTLVSPWTFRHIDIEPQLFEHPHSNMFSGEGQCCPPQLSAKRSTFLYVSF